MAAFEYFVETAKRYCNAGYAHPAFDSRGLRWAKLGRSLFWTHCPECEAMRSRRHEESAWFESNCRRFGALPFRFSGVNLANFNVRDAQQKAALEIATEFVDKYHDIGLIGGSLVFIGKAGTGKTHLACAIANELQKFARVTYATVADVAREVRTGHRGSHTQETENEILDRIAAKPDLLVLDEVGLNLDSSAHSELVHEIIDRRYRSQGSLILVSNLDRSTLTPYLGERAMDRLREVARVVPFAWQSERSAA